jgi:hypothetical protein
MNTLRRVGEDDGDALKVLLSGAAQLREPRVLPVVHFYLRRLHLLSIAPEAQIAQVEHYPLKGKPHLENHSTQRKWELGRPLPRSWKPRRRSKAMAKESRSMREAVLKIGCVFFGG